MAIGIIAHHIGNLETIPPLYFGLRQVMFPERQGTGTFGNYVSTTLNRRVAERFRGTDGTVGVMGEGMCRNMGFVFAAAPVDWISDFQEEEVTFSRTQFGSFGYRVTDQLPSRQEVELLGPDRHTGDLVSRLSQAGRQAGRR